MNITLDLSTALGNVGTAGTGNVSGTAKTASGGNTNSVETTADANVDTVDFSNSARQYLEEGSAAQANDTETSQTSETTEAAEIVSETVTTESEDISASELYSYTDSELLDLVLDGSITRAEYNAEMAERSADSLISE